MSLVLAFLVVSFLGAIILSLCLYYVAWKRKRIERHFRSFFNRPLDRPRSVSPHQSAPIFQTPVHPNPPNECQYGWAEGGGGSGKRNPALIPPLQALAHPTPPPPYEETVNYVPSSRQIFADRRASSIDFNCPLAPPHLPPFPPPYTRSGECQF